MALTDPTTIKPDAFGHRTRYSDSSFYDEICVLCGCNDSDDGLRKVCIKAPADDIGLVTVKVTEVVSRTVVMKATDLHAFKTAFDLAHRHMADNTPPPFPTSATVIETNIYAHEPVKLVRTNA